MFLLPPLPLFIHSFSLTRPRRRVQHWMSCLTNSNRKILHSMPLKVWRDVSDKWSNLFVFCLICWILMPKLPVWAICVCWGTLQHFLPFQSATALCPALPRRTSAAQHQKKRQHGLEQGKGEVAGSSKIWCCSNFYCHHSYWLITLTPYMNRIFGDCYHQAKNKHRYNVSVVLMQPGDFSVCGIQLYWLVDIKLGIAFIRVLQSQQDTWKNVAAADLMISSHYG